MAKLETRTVNRRAVTVDPTADTVLIVATPTDVDPLGDTHAARSVAGAHDAGMALLRLATDVAPSSVTYINDRLWTVSSAGLIAATAIDNASGRSID